MLKKLSECMAEAGLSGDNTAARIIARQYPGDSYASPKAVMLCQCIAETAKLDAMEQDDARRQIKKLVDEIAQGYAAWGFVYPAGWKTVTAQTCLEYYNHKAVQTRADNYRMRYNLLWYPGDEIAIAPVTFGQKQDWHYDSVWRVFKHLCLLDCSSELIYVKPAPNETPLQLWRPVVETVRGHYARALSEHGLKKAIDFLNSIVIPDDSAAEAVRSAYVYETITGIIDIIQSDLNKRFELHDLLPDYYDEIIARLELKNPDVPKWLEQRCVEYRAKLIEKS